MIVQEIRLTQMMVTEELRQVEKVKSEVVDLLDKLEHIVTDRDCRSSSFLHQVKN